MIFQYQDNDEEELEGAMVEYCRIDSRDYNLPTHTVCEAPTVVSARGNNNNDKVRFFSPLS